MGNSVIIPDDGRLLRRSYQLLTLLFTGVSHAQKEDSKRSFQKSRVNRNPKIPIYKKDHPYPN